MKILAQMVFELLSCSCGLDEIDLNQQLAMSQSCLNNKMSVNDVTVYTAANTSDFDF